MQPFHKCTICALYFMNRYNDNQLTCNLLGGCLAIILPPWSLSLSTITSKAIAFVDETRGSLDDFVSLLFDCELDSWLAACLLRPSDVFALSIPLSLPEVRLSALCSTLSLSTDSRLLLIGAVLLPGLELLSRVASELFLLLVGVELPHPIANWKAVSDLENYIYFSKCSCMFKKTSEGHVTMELEIHAYNCRPCKRTRKNWKYIDI